MLSSARWLGWAGGRAAGTTGAALRASVLRPPHVGGVGGGPPTADQGDGAQLLRPVEPDHRASVEDAPLAVASLLIAPDARSALRVEDWHHADQCDEEELPTVSEGDELPVHHDVVDLVDDLAGESGPFPASGPDHVTQGHQNTWRASDVEGAWA
jgi:hypothetical protein